MMPSVVPTMPANTTAVRPTTIDTRAPKISRDSTSRPSWSVPSRYWVLPPVAQSGGLKRAVRLPISGLCGASWLANTATRAMPTRITKGIIGTSPSRSARMAVKRGARGARDGSTMTSAGVLMASALQPDARIDHGIQDVDEQVHDHDHEAAQDHDALDDREVAEGDALVEEPPDARPGEHRLHHHGDIDHDDEVDAGQREHRNEGVLEGVLGDHQGLRQALEPGELDVFRAQHIEHRGAREAHVRGGEIPAEREGRHDQVERSAGARRRQPTEINRENKDQHQAHQEGGQRQAEHREQLAETVP